MPPVIPFTENKDTYQLKEDVKSILKKEGIDLNKPLNRGVTKEIARLINRTPEKVSYIIWRLRKERGINIVTGGNYEVGEIKIKLETNPINDFLLKNNLMRSSPHYEQRSCNTMCIALQNILPVGGDGVLIGTPVPICAPNPKMFWGSGMCADNLAVAIMLQYTCERTKIIIGDSVDNDKAIFKARFWNSFNIINSTIIKTAVNKNSYKSIIEKLCLRRELVKVVFMASGVWKDTAPIPGIDRNFAEATSELVSKFNGLHVLAMIHDADVGYGFRVKYFNKNRSELLSDNLKIRRKET